jgi:hypothetical protein
LDGGLQAAKFILRCWCNKYFRPKLLFYRQSKREEKYADCEINRDYLLKLQMQDPTDAMCLNGLLL